MIVAIDGPAGVGKSTLAQYLAGKWGLIYLNTGRFYRAVTLLAIETSLIPPQNGRMLSAEPLVTLIQGAVWEFSNKEIVVSSRRLSDELHTQKIDAWVSQVSTLVPVRQALNHLFRTFGASFNLVVEGRDMTSEVFPQAEVRIFLDASPQVRANRRFKERPEGQSYEQILKTIQERDKIDREKSVGALKLTKGVLVLETSTLTMLEVCHAADKIIERQSKHL